jgi:hypothetical protein
MLGQATTGRSSTAVVRNRCLPRRCASSPAGVYKIASSGGQEIANRQHCIPSPSQRACACAKRCEYCQDSLGCSRSRAPLPEVGVARAPLASAPGRQLKRPVWRSRSFEWGTPRWRQSSFLTSSMRGRRSPSATPSWWSPTTCSARMTDAGISGSTTATNVIVTRSRIGVSLALRALAPR